MDSRNNFIIKDRKISADTVNLKRLISISNVGIFYFSPWRDIKEEVD